MIMKVKREEIMNKRILNLSFMFSANENHLRKKLMRFDRFGLSRRLAASMYGQWGVVPLKNIISESPNTSTINHL